MQDAQINREAGDALLRVRTVQVLRTGFTITVALLAVGLVLAIIRQEALPHDLDSPAGMVRDALSGDPGGFLGLGIAAVILTPLAATITVMITFLQIGDRRYAFITLAVILVLLVSLSLSML